MVGWQAFNRCQLQTEDIVEWLVHFNRLMHEQESQHNAVWLTLYDNSRFRNALCPVTIILGKPIESTLVVRQCDKWNKAAKELTVFHSPRIGACEHSALGDGRGTVPACVAKLRVARPKAEQRCMLGLQGNGHQEPVKRARYG